MRKRKTQPDLDVVAEAVYRARDSDKVRRLLKPLTPDERKEDWRRSGERIEVDKARFSKLFERVTESMPG
jgi:hypothetical protein